MRPTRQTSLREEHPVERDLLAHVTHLGPKMLSMHGQKPLSGQEPEPEKGRHVRVSRILRGPAQNVDLRLLQNVRGVDSPLEPPVEAHCEPSGAAGRCAGRKARPARTNHPLRRGGPDRRLHSSRSSIRALSVMITARPPGSFTKNRNRHREFSAFDPRSHPGASHVKNAIFRSVVDSRPTLSVNKYLARIALSPRPLRVQKSFTSGEKQSLIATPESNC